MTHYTPVGDPRLARQLSRAIDGEVRFDAFARGLYSTDASIYQVEPIGVVIPRTKADILRTLEIASDADVPIVPRGAGTSQAGQTVGRAIVIDTSKYLTRIVAIDRSAGTVTVEPGVVLDNLNAALAADGAFFPVDVATSNCATIGGMAGNNSAGARSLRYGIMADNVRRIDAVLADGKEIGFGPVPADLHDAVFDDADPRYRDLVRFVRSLYLREQDEIARRVPAVLRHVAGYNLHRVDVEGHNMAQFVVGSEGTLGFFTERELELATLPTSRVLGVCHFPTLHDAMDATQHIVELEPTAVELVDATVLALAGRNPEFARSLERFVRGDPGALLLVEFSGSDGDTTRADLRRLEDLMEELGFRGTVVRAEDPLFQHAIWAVRKAGLNIVMSTRGARKPVSFIEDCAVPLEHLAEYTDRLAEVFAEHDTQATWYAHASVGCLHVRPGLNLKDPDDVATMRSIADDVHAIVREFQGSHSGEHGDGLLRSEFLEPLLGTRLARAFEEIKRYFDPDGRFNPGKIVDAPAMDDRALFRYPPGYHTADDDAVLDWSAWGGFGGAVEMCNNNGACRKRSPGVMCPSFRATADERDVTRGRANALRLALSGQLGADALASDAMYDTMSLCIGCKACRAECPTGVDMARMKIEVLYARARKRGIRLRDRLVANLPRYAPVAARFAALANAGTRLPGSRVVAARILGLSAQRSLPQWRPDFFRRAEVAPTAASKSVILFADTFNTYFEPENVRAAVRVLQAAGYGIELPHAKDGDRPLCCGRTFLNAGLVDRARYEMQRSVDALLPHVDRGMSIVGLEPSCLLTFRDELPALLPGTAFLRVADAALMLEEFIVRERDAGRWELAFPNAPSNRVLVHGHCHQKALGAAPAVSQVLGMIPNLEVDTIAGTCCGMAGSFGYEREHYEVSLAIGELDVLPAVRQAGRDVLIVADGTSCRAQIADGAGREALHVARILEQAMQHAG